MNDSKFCAACQHEGKKSRVHKIDYGVMQTIYRTNDQFWDEDGRHHFHAWLEPDRFRCSNGHSWEERRSSCWCGWPA